MAGAGWAGIAAAAHLAGAGAAVTLLERRARPGGRAFSFPDAEGGPPLDNGQHVLIGCCDRFVDLLGRAGCGGAVRFQPLLRVPVRGDGRWARIGSVRLPGPLHLLPAVAGYAHLDARERLQALRAAAALAGGAPPAGERDQSFAEWLRGRGCGPRTVARFFDLVGVAILNGHAGDVSAAQARAALRRGFMRGWRAAALGLFTAPLGEPADRALGMLAARGVTVLLGTGAAALEVEDGALRAVRLASGERIEAEACVAAVPPDALLALLPPRWRERAPFRGAARLRWSPILNVYLRYDRPVLGEDLAAFLDTDLQFVFNRGRLMGDPALDGRLVGVSVSAAGGLAGRRPQAVVQHLDRQLRDALPTAAAARLEWAVPVWQPHATFLAEPGSGALRPRPESPIRGLYLAGDWTDTGWPACLEGAVRSGEAAARCALEARESAPARAAGA